jgi:hypothetical protein
MFSIFAPRYERNGMLFERLDGIGERLVIDHGPLPKARKKQEKIKNHFYFVLTKTSLTFAVPQETGSKLSAMLKGNKK